MLILLTLLVAFVGLLMYIVCANPKLQEIGRIMFFCGTLAFLLGPTAATTVALLHR